MLRFRDGMTGRPKERPTYEGFLSKQKGRKVLPDLPHAILARLRGYVGGAYPVPLAGEANELGYHPLSSASEDEMRQVTDEMSRVLGSDG